MNASMRPGGASLILSSSCCSLFSYTDKGNKDLFPRTNAVAAPPYPCFGFGVESRAFAFQKSRIKFKVEVKASKTKYLRAKSIPLKDKPDELPIEDDNSSDTNGTNILGVDGEVSIPTRSTVLQACIVTSGVLLALGAVIRQASHITSMREWGTFDASVGVSFDFEMWHIQLIVGLCILISSCRYLLLKTWPDFSESSEAANQQVLSSLELPDYVVVAFLPGISEELLFHGALLPLFGLNWKSALVTGAIFGCLHLGSGRRYSFAVWATFVGFFYGLATIVSSSVIVPMASHSLNNLIGGILWRYTTSRRDKVII